LKMKNNFKKRKNIITSSDDDFKKTKKNDFRVIIFLLKFLKNLPSSLGIHF
jgi:hypothetical protein